MDLAVSVSFYNFFPLHFMKKKKNLAEMFDKTTSCEIVFQNTCRLRATWQESLTMVGQSYLMTFMTCQKSLNLSNNLKGKCR